MFPERSRIRPAPNQEQIRKYYGDKAPAHMLGLPVTGVNGSVFVGNEQVKPFDKTSNTFLYTNGQKWLIFTQLLAGKPFVWNIAPLQNNK